MAHDDHSLTKEADMTGQTMKTKKTGQPFVFGATNKLCVWSRAGVVKPVACMNAFDCLGCAFDQKVQANFEKRQPAATMVDSRSTRMRMLINQRKCRHMLSGRVQYKLCGHGYDCLRCPYDQMLEESASSSQLNTPVCDSASGFNVARDYYYHHGHTWARVEYGGHVRVGLDDFASRMLGPLDDIELPKLGQNVEQNRPQAELSRGANKAQALSPVDGKVLAINPRVSRRAADAHERPYDDGWFMVVQPTSLRKNLKNLLFGNESTAWMDDEASRLSGLLSESSNYQLAATGGEAVSDIYGSVPNVDWNRLVDEFLI
jgi:glycine cleavage system H lipoate-binding protein